MLVPFIIVAPPSCSQPLTHKQNVIHNALVALFTVCDHTEYHVPSFDDALIIASQHAWAENKTAAPSTQCHYTTYKILHYHQLISLPRHNFGYLPSCYDTVDALVTCTGKTFVPNFVKIVQLSHKQQHGETINNFQTSVAISKQNIVYRKNKATCFG